MLPMFIFLVLSLLLKAQNTSQTSCQSLSSCQSLALRPGSFKSFPPTNQTTEIHRDFPCRLQQLIDLFLYSPSESTLHQITVLSLLNHKVIIPKDIEFLIKERGWPSDDLLHKIIEDVDRYPNRQNLQQVLLLSQVYPTVQLPQYIQKLLVRENLITNYDDFDIGLASTIDLKNIRTEIQSQIKPLLAHSSKVDSNQIIRDLTLIQTHMDKHIILNNVDLSSIQTRVQGVLTLSSSLDELAVSSLFNGIMSLLGGLASEEEIYGNQNREIYNNFNLNDCDSTLNHANILKKYLDNYKEFNADLRHSFKIYSTLKAPIETGNFSMVSALKSLSSLSNFRKVQIFIDDILENTITKTKSSPKLLLILLQYRASFANESLISVTKRFDTVNSVFANLIGLGKESPNISLTVILKRIQFLLADLIMADESKAKLVDTLLSKSNAAGNNYLSINPTLTILSKTWFSLRNDIQQINEVLDDVLNQNEMTTQLVAPVLNRLKVMNREELESQKILIDASGEEELLVSSSILSSTPLRAESLIEKSREIFLLTQSLFAKSLENTKNLTSCDREVLELIFDFAKTTITGFIDSAAIGLKYISEVKNLTKVQPRKLSLEHLLSLSDNWNSITTNIDLANEAVDTLVIQLAQRNLTVTNILSLISTYGSVKELQEPIDSLYKKIIGITLKSGESGLNILSQVLFTRQGDISAMVTNANMRYLQVLPLFEDRILKGSFAKYISQRLLITLSMGIDSIINTAITDVEEKDYATRGIIARALSSNFVNSTEHLQMLHENWRRIELEVYRINEVFAMLSETLDFSNITLTSTLRVLLPFNDVPNLQKSIDTLYNVIAKDSLSEGIEGKQVLHELISTRMEEANVMIINTRQQLNQLSHSVGEKIIKSTDVVEQIQAILEQKINFLIQTLVNKSHERVDVLQEIVSNSSLSMLESTISTSTEGFEFIRHCIDLAKGAIQLTLQNVAKRNKIESALKILTSFKSDENLQPNIDNIYELILTKANSGKTDLNILFKILTIKQAEIDSLTVATLQKFLDFQPILVKTISHIPRDSRSNGGLVEIWRSINVFLHDLLFETVEKQGKNRKIEGKQIKANKPLSNLQLKEYVLNTRRVRQNTKRVNNVINILKSKAFSKMNLTSALAMASSFSNNIKLDRAMKTLHNTLTDIAMSERTKRMYLQSETFSFRSHNLDNAILIARRKLSKLQKITQKTTADIGFFEHSSRKPIVILLKGIIDLAKTLIIEAENKAATNKNLIYTTEKKHFATSDVRKSSQNEIVASKLLESASDVIEKVYVIYKASNLSISTLLPLVSKSFHFYNLQPTIDSLYSQILATVAKQKLNGLGILTKILPLRVISTKQLLLNTRTYLSSVLNTVRNRVQFNKNTMNLLNKFNFKVNALINEAEIRRKTSETIVKCAARNHFKMGNSDLNLCLENWDIFRLLINNINMAIYAVSVNQQENTLNIKKISEISQNLDTISLKGSAIDSSYKSFPIGDSQSKFIHIKVGKATNFSKSHSSLNSENREKITERQESLEELVQLERAHLKKLNTIVELTLKNTSEALKSEPNIGPSLLSTFREISSLVANANLREVANRKLVTKSYFKNFNLSKAELRAFVMNLDLAKSEIPPAENVIHDLVMAHKNKQLSYETLSRIFRSLFNVDSSAASINIILDSLHYIVTTDDSSQQPFILSLLPIYQKSLEEALILRQNRAKNIGLLLKSVLIHTTFSSLPFKTQRKLKNRVLSLLEKFLGYAEEHVVVNKQIVNSLNSAKVIDDLVQQYMTNLIKFEKSIGKADVFTKAIISAYVSSNSTFISPVVLALFDKTVSNQTLKSTLSPQTRLILKIILPSKEKLIESKIYSVGILLNLTKIYLKTSENVTSLQNSKVLHFLSKIIFEIKNLFNNAKKQINVIQDLLSSYKAKEYNLAPRELQRLINNMNIAEEYLERATETLSAVNEAFTPIYQALTSGQRKLSKQKLNNFANELKTKEKLFISFEEYAKTGNHFTSSEVKHFNKFFGKAQMVNIKNVKWKSKIEEINKNNNSELNETYIDKRSREKLMELSHNYQNISDNNRISKKIGNDLIAESLHFNSSINYQQLIKNYLRTSKPKLLPVIAKLANANPQVNLPSKIINDLVQYHILNRAVYNQLIRLQQISPSYETLKHIDLISNAFPNERLPQTIQEQLLLAQLIMRVERNELSEMEDLLKIPTLSTKYPFIPTKPKVLDQIKLINLIQQSQKTEKVSPNVLQEISVLSDTHKTFALPKNIREQILLLKTIERAKSHKPSILLLKKISKLSKTYSHVKITSVIRDQIKLVELLDANQKKSLLPYRKLVEISNLANEYPHIPLPRKIAEQVALRRLVESNEPSYESLLQIDRMSAKYSNVPISIQLKQQLHLLHLINQWRKSPETSGKTLRKILKLSKSCSKIHLPPKMQHMVEEISSHSKMSSSEVSNRFAESTLEVSASTSVNVSETLTIENSEFEGSIINNSTLQDRRINKTLSASGVDNVSENTEFVEILSQLLDATEQDPPSKETISKIELLFKNLSEVSLPEGLHDLKMLVLNFKNYKENNVKIIHDIDNLSRQYPQISVLQAIRDRITFKYLCQKAEHNIADLRQIKNLSRNFPNVVISKNLEYKLRYVTLIDQCVSQEASNFTFIRQLIPYRLKFSQLTLPFELSHKIKLIKLIESTISGKLVSMKTIHKISKRIELFPMSELPSVVNKWKKFDKYIHRYRSYSKSGSVSITKASKALLHVAEISTLLPQIVLPADIKTAIEKYKAELLSTEAEEHQQIKLADYASHELSEKNLHKTTSFTQKYEPSPVPRTNQHYINLQKLIEKAMNAPKPSIKLLKRIALLSKKYPKVTIPKGLALKIEFIDIIDMARANGKPSSESLRQILKFLENNSDMQVSDYILELLQLLKYGNSFETASNLFASLEKMTQNSGMSAIPVKKILLPLRQILLEVRCGEAKEYLRKAKVLINDLKKSLLASESAMHHSNAKVFGDVLKKIKNKIQDAETLSDFSKRQILASSNLEFSPQFIIKIKTVFKEVSKKLGEAEGSIRALLSEAEELNKNIVDHVKKVDDSNR